MEPNPMRPITFDAAATIIMRGYRDASMPAVWQWLEDSRGQAADLGHGRYAHRAPTPGGFALTYRGQSYSFKPDAS